MPNSKRPLRLLVFAALALAAAAVLWAMFSALRSAVELWRELQTLPGWLQVVVAVGVSATVLAMLWLAWRMLQPPRRRQARVSTPKRPEVEQRLAALHDAHADTSALQAELEELDRRARTEELYVAVFAEISAGKSSLIRALAPDASAQVDVLGGTTRAVSHHRGALSSGAALILADVPGTHEADGATRERLARDEALRAHVVLYVCAGDLTRDQDAELRWLRGFGKPLVLVLNKADQFSETERTTLAHALHERYDAQTDAQLVVSAGGSESFERQLPDGRHEQVRRDRLPDVAVLRALLERLATRGAAALEPAREAAVLTAVAARADVLAAAARERDAEAVVTKYTKRAVVGALAAVMPGTDLVIQGVLAAALVRELARLYDVPVRDVDVDAFLGRVRLTVRTSASLVLAIAGNALKAFPGLGTLGGGVLHAIAYGLIFDSLGHAVAQTFRDQHALDASAAEASLARLLADAGAERMRRIAAYALQGENPPKTGSQRE
jgi:uncharacterized protein